MEVWIPIRRLPSIHAGGCGSGSGPGTYSSSGSNFVFAMIGYSVIPVPILPQFINFIFYHIDRNPIFVGRLRFEAQRGTSLSLLFSEPPACPPSFRPRHPVRIVPGLKRRRHFQLL